MRARASTPWPPGPTRLARLQRRRVSWLLALGLVFGCAAATPEARPNVVLVVVDTLRADHLSHYGYARPTASALDEFAAQAVRFAQAYATSSWTGPSVASIHTGVLPARHRVDRSGTRLSDDLLTLAELLREHGWHTVGHSLNHYVSRRTGFDQGFDGFADYLGSALTYPDISKMVERVDRWLRASPRQPFFLYLQPMNTHGPYRVPEAARANLLGRPPSDEFEYYGSLMSAILKRGETVRRSEVTAPYLQSLVDQYDTAIRYTTDQLAEVLQVLREQGLYDDALIVVTSDHGEELFEHGGFSHGYSLHREVLHVPLYLKLPGQRRGRVVEERVSLLDLLPTLLELLEIPVEPHLEGRSLLSLLRAPSDASVAPAARPFLHQIDWRERCVARSIVSGRYKLIELARNYEGRLDQPLLYDIQQDPSETENLADTRTDIVEQLRGELDESLRRSRAQAVSEPANVLDEMDREKLEALGYL